MDRALSRWRLKMTPEVHILAWWLLFGGTHVIGSTMAVRTKLIDTLGLTGFKGVYSLVSFATFIPLCWVYFTNRHAGAQLFVASPELNLASQGLMLLAFLVVVQGFTADNPLTTHSEIAGHYTSEATGILRITRHPVNTGAALIGLAHVLSNPFVGDWIFWGGFVVYSVISAYHQDARKAAAGPEAVREFLASTSRMPFGAIVAGRQRLAPRELRPVGLVIAVALFLLLRAYHGAWFGGFGG
jgi:uncharacterized membrane protein